MNNCINLPASVIWIWISRIFWPTIKALQEKCAHGLHQVSVYVIYVELWVCTFIGVNLIKKDKSPQWLFKFELNVVCTVQDFLALGFHIELIFTVRSEICMLWAKETYPFPLNPNLQLIPGRNGCWEESQMSPGLKMVKDNWRENKKGKQGRKMNARSG